MLHVIDVSVLALYTLGIIGLGFYFSKRAKTAEGFTLGGRSMSGFSVGFSLVGTMISSISFIAFPGKAYASDWNAFVFSFTIVIVGIVALKFFQPFYRKLGVVSAYEFLEIRFGYWGRIYGVLSFLMLSIGRIGIILYLLCLPLHHLLGWDLVTLIIITGVLTTLYTFIGGITAVIWTDVAQVFVLFGGAILCLVTIFMAMPHGPAQLMEMAIANDKFGLGSFKFDFVDSSFWLVLVFGITENLKNFGVDQTYVQRYVVAKSDKEAAKSIWIGCLSFVPLAFVFFMIGTGLYVFYQVFPADNLPGKADEVFPYFIVANLPVGVRGLLISALFAAAMSSISSSLNSMATVTMEDLIKRLSRRRSDREEVKLLRITTIAFGTVGTLTGIAMISVKQALDVWWQLSAVFGGGILGLFLVGSLNKTIKSATAVPAVLVSVIVIGWITYSDQFTLYQKILAGFFGTVALLVTAFGGHYILRWSRKN